MNQTLQQYIDLPMVSLSPPNDKQFQINNVTMYAAAATERTKNLFMSCWSTVPKSSKGLMVLKPKAPR